MYIIDKIEKGLIVIEDDIYSKQNHSLPPAVANYVPKQAVYLSGFSKTVSLGLYLIYMSLSRQYKDAVSNAL